MEILLNFPGSFQCYKYSQNANIYVRFGPKSGKHFSQKACLAWNR